MEKKKQARRGNHILSYLRFMFCAGLLLKPCKYIQGETFRDEKKTKSRGRNCYRSEQSEERRV
uniref:Uncharacterized protein n=1 Tax=Daucus carota subsp. sativus TaxID=79200 RepID=A0A166B1Q0_DAUCS